MSIYRDVQEERPEWLKTLSEADCKAGMPESGQSKLMAAYRARKRSAQVRLWSKFAAAAALAAILWIPFQHRAALMPAVDNEDDDSQALLSDAIAAASADGEENSFVPTLYASSGQPIESLRLVHVSVPKESLAQYGVRPPDVQTDEVAADLLVGQDGIARAIRINK